MNITGHFGTVISDTYYSNYNGMGAFSYTMGLTANRVINSGTTALFNIVSFNASNGWT